MSLPLSTSTESEGYGSNHFILFEMIVADRIPYCKPRLAIADEEELAVDGTVIYYRYLHERRERKTFRNLMSEEPATQHADAGQGQAQLDLLVFRWNSNRNGLSCLALPRTRGLYYKINHARILRAEYVGAYDQSIRTDVIAPHFKDKKNVNLVGVPLAGFSALAKAETQKVRVRTSQGNIAPNISLGVDIQTVPTPKASSGNQLAEFEKRGMRPNSREDAQAYKLA
ncbi:hypothetical protein BST61_g11475 [Cercospora zeina]